MNVSVIVLELIIGYIALFIITKMLGKGTISQLTPFDFIAAILLGELVGGAVFDPEVKIRHLILGLLIWFLLVYVTEIISQKFNSSRKLLEGEPSIVIHQGRLKREVMKENKMDINQLQHLLRLQNAFSIRDVEYAVLETDGQISVMKKPQFQSPTMSDMKLPTQPSLLPVNIILDGEVLWENLKRIKKDEEWLHNQLLANSIHSYKDVFYADYKENEGLFVDPYE